MERCTNARGNTEVGSGAVAKPETRGQPRKTGSKHDTRRHRTTQEKRSKTGNQRKIAENRLKNRAPANTRGTSKKGSKTGNQRQPEEAGGKRLEKPDTRRNRANQEKEARTLCRVGQPQRCNITPRRTAKRGNC